MEATYKKDPQAVLDYGFDWTDWLTGGETITTSVWTISPAGLNKDSDSHDTTKTTIWVSGGAALTQYKLVNHITTSAGRQDDRTLTLNVLNR